MVLLVLLVVEREQQKEGWEVMQVVVRALLEAGGDVCYKPDRSVDQEEGQQQRVAYKPGQNAVGRGQGCW